MVNKIFRDGQRVFSNNAHEKKGRNFLLVYVAGHGVSDQMQDFVLNDAFHNLVNIEMKLRALSKGSDTNVLAFYDICRSKKSSFPSLKRGGGDNDAGLADDDEFAESYQYMHIGTHPNQTVDAKSQLAKLTIKQLTRKSGEDPNGLVFIPGCFTGLGAEKTDTGDSYALTWNKKLAPTPT